MESRRSHPRKNALRGVAKWRARQLELALIREFIEELGPDALFNTNGRYGRGPLPEAITTVRRRKHLWRYRP